MKKCLILAINEVDFVTHSVLNEFLQDRSFYIITVYVHATTKVKNCGLNNKLYRK